MASELKQFKKFKIQSVGELGLRGKEGKSKIYSVDNSEQTLNMIK